MRICFTVQRYGQDVPGGAEMHCRLVAEHLVRCGHEVSVLTSCARSYVTWHNEYPAGETIINGVRVFRLPVAAPRDGELFPPLSARIIGGNGAMPLSTQEQWLRLQGPILEGQESWYVEHSAAFDVHFFFTYLYAPTAFGIRVASRLGPTILQSTAHDEPPFWFPVFDPIFHDATAFAFSTPEEEDLIRRRSGSTSPGSVIGIGVDLDTAGQGARFRDSYGLGDDPLVLFLGRVDPAKGSVELIEFFEAFKKRNRSDVRLLIVGDAVGEVPSSDAIVATGYVDDATRNDAIAACDVFVQPSYFESFSMALAEAWAQRKPALVQGHCDVLRGQVERSHGGIPYQGYAEFECSLEMVLGDARLARQLGDAGRTYVEENYDWSVVMDRYEALLDRAVGSCRKSVNEA